MEFAFFLIISVLCGFLIRPDAGKASLDNLINELMNREWGHGVSIVSFRMGSMPDHGFDNRCGLLAISQI